MVPAAGLTPLRPAVAASRRRARDMEIPTTRRMSRPRPAHGFTLLELLVVLAMAALLLAVVPPMVGNALPGLKLKGSARELAAALRYARGYAAVHGREAVLRLDLEGRRYTVTGRDRSYQVPEALGLELVTARTERTAEQQGAIRFFPDGGSTGGRITVSYEGRSYRVDVDWLTGRVRISAPDT